MNYLYHLLFSDAEIYEVHPETRLRITAEEHKPSPHTTPEITTGSEYSAGFDDETTLPSDFVETTTELFHETTYQTGEELNKLVSSTIDSVTTVFDESSTITPEIHETADAHSTFAPVLENLTISAEEPKEFDEIIFIEPLELDIQNEVIDQEYEESKYVHTAWSDAEIIPEPTVAGRLTNYRKHIDTSKYGEDQEYSVGDLSPSVNEHGQQGVENQESGLEDVVETDKIEAWKPSVIPFRPYTEIDRSAGSPVPSIEEVEITESKDYSEPDILYDDSKVGFNDEIHKKYYSVPVFAQLNLPETSTRQEITAAYESTTALPTTAFTSTHVAHITGGPSTTTDTVYEGETTTVFEYVAETTSSDPEKETTSSELENESISSYLKKETTSMEPEKETTSLELEMETTSLELEMETTSLEFEKETTSFELKKEVLTTEATTHETRKQVI